jgi:hypothetical protein
VPPDLALGKEIFLFFEFLCRVPPDLALDKDFFLKKMNFFAECP